MEYLSVLKVKKDATPPIICFVGPVSSLVNKYVHALLNAPIQPGVGKTTLGKSIASALDRKFHRMALGGVRDEAEIRYFIALYGGSVSNENLNG